MHNFYRGPSTHLNQWEAEAFARKLAPIEKPVRHDNHRVSRRGCGPSDSWLTAVHEAGHAIGALSQNIPVIALWMDNRGGGYCLNARPKDSKSKPNADDGKKMLARVTDGLKPSAAARRIFFKPLVMTLCGEVAQRRAGWDRSDEYHRVRCRNDRKQWLSVLDVITETRADGVAMMREMTSEAHRIIDAHWELLEELARELLQYRKLDEHEIKQIVGDLSPVEQSPDRSSFSRVDGYLLPATSKPIRNRAARRPMMIGDESLGYEVPLTW
jgi:hypothetical protein